MFVSHSLPNVKDFCDRVMWLDNGKIRMLGDSSEVVDAYREHARSRNAAKREKGTK